MPFRKSPSMDRTGVEQMAEGWGKIVARRVHEDVGADLDLDADDIEQMAVTAACAVARGTIEELLKRRPPSSVPSSLARRASGPLSCNASHERSTSGAARSPTPNPSATARLVAGIFFPQRPGLRLTPHDYSPSVLGKIVRSAAREPSFREAAEAMADLAEVTISSRQIGRIAQEVGQQLQASRDHHVSQFQADELEPRVATRPALAVVEVDGGRLQIRGEGKGPGAHEASWREDKIAILATMANVVSACDPEPELPACFRDRGYVEKLIGGIGGDGSMGPPAASAEGFVDPAAAAGARSHPTEGAGTRGADLRGQYLPQRAVRADGRRRGPAAQLHGGGPPGVPGGRLGLDLGPAGVALPDLRGHRRFPPRPGPPVRGGQGRGDRDRGALGVVPGLGGGLLEGARGPGDRGTSHPAGRAGVPCRWPTSNAWPTMTRGRSSPASSAIWNTIGSGWTTRVIVARDCRGRPVTWSRR